MFDDRNRVETMFVWLGGADRRELRGRHERSTHAIAGAVVVAGAVLAWLVATLAIAAATQWPLAPVVVSALVFGVLVGAVGCAFASNPASGPARGVLGRAEVALLVGVLVGELAAVVLFAGSIDRRLDEQAARSADSVPAVVAALADLDRSRTARAALNDAVEQARAHRDEALVVARCEYNPTPGCPLTHITGEPGVGLEADTAQAFLADAERELGNAQAERDRQAPPLDARIGADEQALAQIRQAATADAEAGLGARWVAMNDHTLATPGALVARLFTVGFFVLLSLLPLILRRWRGESSQDRGAAAAAERERAELEADTAIAVKRAEVRAAAEALWAEQQLASTRLAVEAQTRIDRELQRRRVIDALEPPVQVQSERTPEPAVQVEGERTPELAVRVESERTPEPAAGNIHLPIAAEAEVASLAAPEPRRPAEQSPSPETLPAKAEESGRPPSPVIPDVTEVAVRWMRLFMPPIFGRATDTTSAPVRSAWQVSEDIEETNYTRKRTRTVVTYSSETSETGESDESGEAPLQGTHWVSSSTGGGDYRDDHMQLDAPTAAAVADSGRRSELNDREGPRELGGPDGPRELPPAPTE